VAVRKNTEQQTYLETSILTAAPEDLIVKIFDVLIIATQQAHEKLMNQRDDIEGIHKALLRAQRACTVLMSSLNMEIGGELSENLLRVYGFWHRELVMANMRKDPTRVERILGYAREYRETWNVAVTQFKAQKRAQTSLAGGDGMTSTFAAVG
jgi:flagellar secretion chaperone FliS